MRFVTKSGYTYEMLKKDIVEGMYEPGEKIVVADVASRYSVSPMPVREALTRLQHEGWVTVEPHVGARVASFPLKKQLDTMLARNHLESLAAYLAAYNISEKNLVRLENLYREMDAALTDGDFVSYGFGNKDFHNIIYHSCENPTLIETIDSMINRSSISQMTFTTMPHRNRDSHKEHRAWLDALKARDGLRSSQVLSYQKLSSFIQFYSDFKEYLDMYDLGQTTPQQDRRFKFYLQYDDSLSNEEERNEMRRVLDNYIQYCYELRPDLEL